MKYYSWVFLFFIVAYLLPLGGRPMVTPDEFRYAEIPREMLASGDWVTPRMLNVRYFEKPVMGYWLTATSFRFFGENAFASRLPAALGAGLAAFLIGLLAYQTLRDEKVAALAALFVLSSGLVYGVGTFAVLDLPLTGFVIGSSVMAYLAMMEQRFSRRKIFLLILCGLFAGAAFLTKGFLAFVVPGLTVLAFIIWERRWKELWQLPWIPLMCVGGIVLPWALAIHRAEPDFWRYFVVEEHLNRFLGGESSEHPEPFWFFIPVLLGGIFPAALIWLPELFRIGRKRIEELLKLPVCRFCLCAVVLPFLFFSVSSGKLATYILPCFPPLALIGAMVTASYFRTGKHSAVFHWTMNLVGVVFLLAGIGVMVILGADLFADYLIERRFMMWSTAIAGVGFGGILLISRRQLWRVRFYLFWSGLAVILALGGWSIPDSLLGDKTPKQTLLRLAKQLDVDPATAIFVTPQRTMHAVAWTFRRADVRVSGSQGELDYGEAWARKKAERPVGISYQELATLSTRPNRPQIALVIQHRNDDYDTLLHYTHKREAEFNQMKMIVVPVGEKITEKK